MFKSYLFNVQITNIGIPFTLRWIYEFIAFLQIANPCDNTRKAEYKHSFMYLFNNSHFSNFLLSLHLEISC